MVPAQPRSPDIRDRDTLPGRLKKTYDACLRDVRLPRAYHKPRAMRDGPGINNTAAAIQDAQYRLSDVHDFRTRERSPGPAEHPTCKKIPAMKKPPSGSGGAFSSKKKERLCGGQTASSPPGERYAFRTARPSPARSAGKNGHPVAPVLFGGVKRLIRLCQQRIKRCRIAQSAAGHAHADRKQTSRRAGMGYARTADALQNPCGDTSGHAGIRAGNEHHELFPAVTENGVGRTAQTALCGRRHTAKTPVAFQMPEGVVILFEKIIAIKYDVPNDRLEMFAQYRREIDAFYQRVLEKNA